MASKTNWRTGSESLWVCSRCYKNRRLTRLVHLVQYQQQMCQKAQEQGEEVILPLNVLPTSSHFHLRAILN